VYACRTRKNGKQNPRVYYERRPQKVNDDTPLLQTMPHLLRCVIVKMVRKNEIAIFPVTMATCTAAELAEHALDSQIGTRVNTRSWAITGTFDLAATIKLLTCFRTGYGFMYSIRWKDGGRVEVNRF
jgi:hypothetical protein